MLSDDELAQAVIDALAGVRRCPDCNRVMSYVPFHNGIGSYMIWRCHDSSHDRIIEDESTVHIDQW